MRDGTLILGNTERLGNRHGQGLTHVIDLGTPLGHLSDILAFVGRFVDIWKLGFGTAFLDPTIEEKVRLLRQSEVQPCLGGTLLEAAWLESKTRALLDWAAERDFQMVEVSNGTVEMDRAEKRKLIELATERFEVIAEVGSKDPSRPVSATAWCEQMRDDIEAGARFGITEGRESGTVGLFEQDGTLRWNVAEALADEVGAERVIFEAPKTSQQAALIRRFGPNVNLGNIKTDGVLALEALRRGLRADTLSYRLGEAKL